MIRCAAIAYMSDQNAPSRPFVLDLPAVATKESWLELATAVLTATFREQFGLDEDGMDAEYRDQVITVEDGDVYGDLEVRGADCGALFVSFPPEDRNRLRMILGLPIG